MPISIHVAGTNDFHRTRRAISEDELFEDMGWASRITRRAVGAAPRGSMTGSAVRRMMHEYGRVSAGAALTDALTLLMAEASPESWLGLHASSSGIILSSSAYERISLYGDDPLPVMQDICRVLLRAELNYWSVLLEMAAMISEYSSRESGHGLRMLLFQVWK